MNNGPFLLIDVNNVHFSHNILIMKTITQKCLHNFLSGKVFTSFSHTATRLLKCFLIGRKQATAQYQWVASKINGLLAPKARCASFYPCSQCHILTSFEVAQSFLILEGRAHQLLYDRFIRLDREVFETLAYVLCSACTLTDLLSIILIISCPLRWTNSASFTGHLSESLWSHRRCCTSNYFTLCGSARRRVSTRTSSIDCF